MGFGGKFLKSIFGRKEPSNFFTKADYYDQFYVPKSLADIRKLITGNGKTCIQAKGTIEFKLVAFDTPLKKVVKALGKPKYRLDNNHNIDGHEVLFYKYVIGGFKTVAQLHFLDKRFFIGQYLFNEIDSVKFESVKKLVLQKYLTAEAADLNKTVLCDSSQNKLEIQDIAYGIISYISGNPEIQKRFDLEAEKQLILKQQEEKGTLNELYESL